MSLDENSPVKALVPLPRLDVKAGEPGKIVRRVAEGIYLVRFKNDKDKDVVLYLGEQFAPEQDVPAPQAADAEKQVDG